MSTETEAKPGIGPEQADKAFKTVVEAIDLALTGRLPLGIDHIEVHMKIKQALLDLSDVMTQQFGEPEVTGPGTSPEETESALVAEPTTKGD